MWRFILITFGFLGFAFYELSGGADYAPRDDSLQVAQAEKRALRDQKALALAEAKPQPVFTPKPAAPNAEEVPAESELILALASVETLSSNSEEPKPEPVTLVNPLINTQKAATLTASSANVGKDIRTVIKPRVNMRGGPSTDYKRVGQLTNGAEVEVVEDLGNGWVELYVPATGETGFMADFLLSEPSAALSSN